MPDIFQSLRRERLDSPFGPVYYWINAVNRLIDGFLERLRTEVPNAAL